MTREELLKIHESICSDARSLMRKKNADYAGNDGLEPFANFTRVQAMGICSTEQGFLVRMTDKMSRLSSFVESGKLAVENESFKDTIVDIVNYSVLLYAYLNDKANSKNITEDLKSCDEIKKSESKFKECRSYYISSPRTSSFLNS